MQKTRLNAELNAYLADIQSEFGDIPAERIRTLESIGDYISASLQNHHTADLIFICTHNSRRSQFGQIWATTAAQYYGLEGIRSFSGGTESTAFNPKAVAALRRAGFDVENSSGQEVNPLYRVSNGAGGRSTGMYSKRYDDPANPGRNFCAIMVCSDADEACPFVPGADERISLPYDDPKDFDGTELESQKYDERCREIARDLFYVFSYVSNNQ